MFQKEINMNKIKSVLVGMTLVAGVAFGFAGCNMNAVESADSAPALSVSKITCKSEVEGQTFSARKQEAGSNNVIIRLSGDSTITGYIFKFEVESMSGYESFSIDGTQMYDVVLGMNIGYVIDWAYNEDVKVTLKKVMPKTFNVKVASEVSGVDFSVNGKAKGESFTVTFGKEKMILKASGMKDGKTYKINVTGADGKQLNSFRASVAKLKTQLESAEGFEISNTFVSSLARNGNPYDGLTFTFVEVQ